jgi:SAM-dependent methyltransferase
VRFLVDDIEDEWISPTAPGGSGGGYYDYIHMRHSCAYPTDVDNLLQRCHESLRPGGWCEFSDYGGYALCDDGSMPDDYPVNVCFRLIADAMASMGRNFLVANQHGDNFARAGFRNVQCKMIKTPIGTWPKVRERN